MVIYAIVQAYKNSSTSKYNLENYLTRNNIHTLFGKWDKLICVGSIYSYFLINIYTFTLIDYFQVSKVYKFLHVWIARLSAQQPFQKRAQGANSRSEKIAAIGGHVTICCSLASNRLYLNYFNF